MSDSNKPRGPGPLPPSWVPGCVRRGERLMLLGLGAIAAGVAACLSPGLPAAWALVLLAILCAGWSRLEPAVHAAQLALRGTLLVSGALLLQLREPEQAQAAELAAQVWIGVVCVAYAWLLPCRWSFGIAAFALAALGLLHSAEGVAGVSALLGDAFLVLCPTLLGAAAGLPLRRAGRRRDTRRFDPATGLRNREGLLDWGHARLRSGRRTAAMTLAVIDAADLLEVRSVYGTAAARELALRLSARLAALAGERGAAARIAPTRFGVLLPLGHDAALDALRAALGSPARIECEIGGEEIVLVADHAAQVLDPQDDDLADLLDVLTRRLAGAREHEVRRQRYLRRERERHSRPLALRAEPVGSAS